MKLPYHLFCSDIDAQMRFYGQLLHLRELRERRSPIYRALDTGDAELGFNSAEAYKLLALAERKAASGPATPVTGYATFMVDTAGDVDAAASNVIALGGGVIKAPHKTYYGEWQAVLRDPEQRVFRVSSVLQ